MIRILLFFIVIIGVFFAVVKLMETEGTVLISMLSYEIELSAAYAVGGVAIAFVLLAGLLQLLLFVINIPTRARRSTEQGRRRKMIEQMRESMIALHTGEEARLRRAGRAVSKLARDGDESVTHMMDAHIARLDGDLQESSKHYHSLLDDEKTRLFALGGLLDIALKKGAKQQALEYARQIFEHAPYGAGALDNVLSLYKSTGKWAEYVEFIRKNRMTIERDASGIVAQYEFAVAHVMYAKELMGKDDDAAMDIAKKAYNFMPSFLPAAEIYARALISAHKEGKVSAVLEKNWRLAPHPEIALLYVNLHAQDRPEKRLKRARHLCGLVPHHIEGYRIMALTALHAGKLSQAEEYTRKAIDIRKTSSLCLMMAEVLRRKETSLQIAGDAAKEVAQLDNIDGDMDTQPADVAMIYTPEEVRKEEESEGNVRDNFRKNASSAAPSPEEESSHYWAEQAKYALPDASWGCKACGNAADQWSLECSSCGTTDSIIYDNPPWIDGSGSLKRSAERAYATLRGGMSADGGGAELLKIAPL